MMRIHAIYPGLVRLGIIYVGKAQAKIQQTREIVKREHYSIHCDDKLHTVILHMQIGLLIIISEWSKFATKLMRILLKNFFLWWIIVTVLNVDERKLSLIMLNYPINLFSNPLSSIRYMLSSPINSNSQIRA